jgi:hypothetical protein
MFNFLLVLVVPLLIGASSFLFTNFFPQGSRWRRRVISWKEFLILVGISILVSGGSMAIIYHMNTTYKEMWNGIVTGKARVKVSCEHSYQCN